MILKISSYPSPSNEISFDNHLSFRMHFIPKFVMCTLGRFIVYHDRSVSRVGVTTSVLLFLAR